METALTSSSYDVIVIQHSSAVLKSTPFQVVFASSVLKAYEKYQLDKIKAKQSSKKLFQIMCQVNDQPVDIPTWLDPKNGRVNFVKAYSSKKSVMSDSSDMSDEQLSQRSTSRQKRLSGVNKTEKIEQLKNEQAPKTFWQFAWLFNRKKEEDVPPHPSLNLSEEKSLAKINEEMYEGEESSKQPIFHLSLCGQYLKKKEKQPKEQILKTFYEYRVEYQDFIKDPPAYINDNNLLVRIDDSIYTWQLGIAILTCRFAYGKELSRTLIDDMIRNKFTKSKLLAYFSGSNVTKLDINQAQEKSASAVLQSPPLNSNLSSPLNSNLSPNQSELVLKYRKTPDSETLLKMKLKYGCNRCKFTLDIGTGIEEINMKIFLWDQSQKIVISDIDGTITKSDILGQILNNYIHEGVSKLFSEIERRNYKMVYLTARAIGQYKQTRKFLDSAEENGCKLPEGPVLMSPDGYMRSFTREVIDKTPDYLKVKILATLNEIFPSSKRPMYAGFGNRETDNIAYLRIKIPEEMIFSISEKSVITSETNKATTYMGLLQQVDELFPFYTKPKQEPEEDIKTSQRHSNLNSNQNSSEIDEEEVFERKLSVNDYRKNEKSTNFARSEEDACEQKDMADLDQLIKQTLSSRAQKSENLESSK